MTVPEVTKTEGDTAPKRHRHRKAWLWIGVLLVLWGGVLIVLHILNTPAQGVVTVHPMPDTTQQAERRITLKGKTATFQYPAKVQKVKADSLAVGDIEKFLFSYPQHGDWSLAILVKKLPGGVLAQDGNYNLRKQNPHQYIEQTLTVNGATVSVMTDHSATYSQVAFMTHADMVAEIALSGQESSADESQAIFSTVLNSWQWR